MRGVEMSHSRALLRRIFDEITPDEIVAEILEEVRRELTSQIRYYHDIDAAVAFGVGIACRMIQEKEEELKKVSTD